MSGQSAPVEIDVQVQNLRNTNGVVRLCLSRDPTHFPNCDRDPAAVSRSVPARAAGSVRFTGLAPGTWALGVIHDEDGNGRLNTFMGIPREGFGFSRNPAIRFGPPVFTRAAFTVGAVPVRETIRMRYIL